MTKILLSHYFYLGCRVRVRVSRVTRGMTGA